MAIYDNKYIQDKDIILSENEQNILFLFFIIILS